MGKIFSTMSNCPEYLASTVKDVYNRSKVKRKRESEATEDAELLESLHVSKKMKLQCTAQYIYQALFIEGKDSDITVNILNKDWKLHKIYLGQSQYFSSMFSGSWNETNKSYISIEVQDPNITEEALRIVFGSFYLDEVAMEACEVVGVMAAASMFQMEGLIEQARHLMSQSICPLTAVQYYQASCDYGLNNVKEKVLDWFLINLTDYYFKNMKKLQDIDIDLMESIVSQPNLHVIQTEMALYYILRKWLYFKLHSDQLTPEEPSPTLVEHYFRKIKGEKPFLLTEEGSQYLRIFKLLRVQNILLNAGDSLTLCEDGILPQVWLLEAYRSQWATLLDIFSGSKGVSEVDESYFYQNCFRCGRILGPNDTLSWRWSGFSFGVDLIWTLSDNCVSVKRQRTQLEYVNSINAPHQALLRVQLFNLDERRQVKRAADSGLMSLTISRNQDVKILTFDKEFDYPIYFVLKLLLSDREKRQKNENTV